VVGVVFPFKPKFIGMLHNTSIGSLGVVGVVFPFKPIIELNLLQLYLSINLFIQ
jgi:hypothetical protein